MAAAVHLAALLVGNAGLVSGPRILSDQRVSRIARGLGAVSAM
jgi:hypothetical protein